MTDDIGGSSGGFGEYPVVSLIKLFDECPSADPVAPYQSRVREWATTYLSQSHPELGREGPVCPFTATAIARETFWLGCVDRSDLTAADIEKTMAGIILEFHRMQPTAGDGVLFKTILVLFPGVTDYTKIDKAQQVLKEKSVPNGLMIGQFYPGCAAPGIRNSGFKPLQSPIPLLAIRHMVGSDLPFLTEKGEWVEEYLKRFTPPVTTLCGR